MTSNRVKLSDIDRDHLVHAVESATKIQRQEDFRTWISSDFYALLPHESMVCVEIDEYGVSHLVDCFQHNTAELSDEWIFELSLCLLRSQAKNAPISHLMDAWTIRALTDCNSHADSDIARKIQNAVIHRIEFLSGARYHLVLFNLLQDKAQRSTHLFKLLSSHVKMALSWRIAHREQGKRTPLTPRELEILERMSKGGSNREISTLLGINPMTLKAHIAKIYRKLDVQSRAEAVLHGQNAVANGESKQS